MWITGAGFMSYDPSTSPTYVNASGNESLTVYKYNFVVQSSFGAQAGYEYFGLASTQFIGQKFFTNKSVLYIIMPNESHQAVG